MSTLSQLPYLFTAIIVQRSHSPTSSSLPVTYSTLHTYVRSRFGSSEMWCRVVWQISTKVSTRRNKVEGSSETPVLTNQATQCHVTESHSLREPNCGFKYTIQTQDIKHTISAIQILFNAYFTTLVCRDSSVGIATGYGLGGPGSNPGGGEIFRTCPDRPCGPPSLLYSGFRVFPGGKERPGRDADHSPLSSAVVMKW